MLGAQSLSRWSWGTVVLGRGVHFQRVPPTLPPTVPHMGRGAGPGRALGAACELAGTPEGLAPGNLGSWED